MITYDNKVHRLLGVQVAHLMANYSTYDQRSLALEPDTRHDLLVGMSKFANIELSRHYVLEHITNTRHFDLLDWQIDKFGSADFIDEHFENAIKLN